MEVIILVLVVVVAGMALAAIEGSAVSRFVAILLGFTVGVVQQILIDILQMIR